MTMRGTPHSQSLPLELQTKILDYLNTSNERDLGFLWTSLRNVSHTFRSIVDGLVRKKHLKYTSIKYYIDWLDTSTEFVFNRISPENSTIAVFKAEVADKHKQSIKIGIRGKGVGEEGRELNIYEPPHRVYIRRTANDTELPDFSIDFENWEVSCNWKGLFAAVLYEEKLVDTYTHAYAEAFIASRPQGGPPATPEVMLNILMAYANNNDENRKKARRSRIARQCARIGCEFDEEMLEYKEEEIMKALKNAAWTGNFVRFPDEAAEAEEDEGPSQDDDENWETSDDGEFGDDEENGDDME